MAETIKPSSNPGKGQATATSAYMAGLGYTKTTAESDGHQLVPYAVMNYKLYSEYIEDNAERRYDSVIETTINAIASSYYAEDLADGVIDDIKDKFYHVIKDSLCVYSFILTLWKMQNLRHIHDQDERQLAWMFATNVNVNSSVLIINNAPQIGNFAITNDSWANDFLKKLSNIRLGKTMRNQLEFLIGNVFLLSRQDNTVRWANLLFEDKDPANGDIYDNKTRALEYLDSKIASIKAAFAKYPCLKPLCEVAGLSTGRSEFNFTRDLSGLTLYQYEDTTGDIEYMLYSVGLPWIDDGGTTKWGSATGVVSSTATKITFKDGVLSAPDRVAFDVLSLTNLLRKGTVTSRGITFMMLDVNDATQEVTEHHFHMYGDIIQPTSNNSAATLVTIANINAYQMMIDPIGSVVITNYDNNAPKNFTCFYGTDDFLQNAGDILLVSSEAAFNILYAEATYEDIAKERTLTMNTKGAGDGV
jgi:hypothetical protein